MIRKSLSVLSQAIKSKLASARKAASHQAEVEQLSKNLDQLKVHYEQFFLGILKLAPFREHTDFKKSLDKVRRLPFLTSQEKFQIRNTESRYTTFNAYWEKNLREKENGTYARDQFKADLKDKQSGYLSRDRVAELAASLREKIKSVNEFLNIDISDQKFEIFLRAKANQLLAQTDGRAVDFDVVVKEGKLGIVGRVKDQTDLNKK